jgi:carboxyl-terminal processing protease
MLKLSFRYFLLLRISFAATIFLVSQDTFSQCKTSVRTKVMVQTLARVHVSPIQNNEHNSSAIAEAFFLKIDPYRILYSQVDLSDAAVHRKYFLDTLDHHNCDFIEQMLVLHKERLIKFHKELGEYTSSAITFLKGDSITLNWSRHREFTKNDDERKKRFQKIMRYRTLMQADELAEENGTIAATLKTNESQIRLLIKEDLDCEVDILNQLKTDQEISDYLMEALLQAIAEGYDPHTQYFSIEKKNAFSALVSSDGKSFGIIIDDNENNEKIIAGLIPGSAAWKQNNVHVEDKILSIKLGAKAIEDFRCTSGEELSAMLDNSAENRVELQLQKSSGEKILVQLRKEVIQSEDNVINGLILENDKQKVGYISLPAFYSSGSFYVDKGCANDVGKEILKMKAEGIKGLILDLRNNGGGNLGETIDLAGLFIDVGPIGMLVDNTGKPGILKELSKGVLFDGPLIIMINGFSASASEFLAGVLQDYNRALIVGSTSYGKSTAQSIFPIYNSINQFNSKNEPLAFVKATQSIGYRITGYSHQKKGVVPDLQLTNVYGQLGISESTYPNAIDAEFVDKPLIYKKFKSLPIEELQKRSKARLDNDEVVQYIISNKSKWQKSEYTLHLDPTSFDKELLKLNAHKEFMEEIVPRLKCPFSVTTTTANLSVIAMDEYLKEVFEFQKQDANEDFQLHETFLILCDLISLSNQ